MLWLVSYFRPHLVVVTTSEELMTVWLHEARHGRRGSSKHPKPPIAFNTYIRSPPDFFLK